MAPSRPLTWGEALSFAGDFFLNLGWIQQGFHTVFQTNASLGDKAKAGGLALAGIGLDVLQFTLAGWLSNAAKAARLAKGADAAITAVNDAEKTISAADEAVTPPIRGQRIWRAFARRADCPSPRTPR